MEIDPVVQEQIEKTKIKYHEAVKEFKFHEALAVLWELFSFANAYINEKAPWKDEKTRSTTIFVSLNLVNSLSVLIAPFLPFTALEIKKQLGKKAILSV